MLAVGGLLLSLPALTHDFWIEPLDFSPEVGARVDVSLRVGMDFSGDTVPYIPDWFSDYRVVDARGARPVEGITGDDPAGSFEVRAPGLQVVGYRSTVDFVDMEPEKFIEYLKDEGLEHVIALREQRGESDRSAPEFYSRCAKSLLRAGGGRGGHDAVLGYTLELVPEADPYALEPGSQLPLRLIYRGNPIEDILVIAFTSDRPDEKVSIRTDSQGRVAVPLDRPGVWLIKAVHLIETDPGVRADWESFWASLTFELPRD